MISVESLRGQKTRMISIGSHAGILQSILDYDYLVGRQEPSIIAIVANGRKQERYFWGEHEVIIPVVADLNLLSHEQLASCTVVINVQSARRVLYSTKHALELLPNVSVLTIFAEQTPESHALEILKLAEARDVLVVGPSSVGLLVPGVMKLGAIGGTQHEQLSAAGIFNAGDTAVVSTSGGIVNELILTVTGAGLGVSFAIALGGDRFPVTSPIDAMRLAQADPLTERIVFFGELGGADEYEIAKSIARGEISKPVIAYIAGRVAELFDTPPQFGHAKAIAQVYDESASAKKEALSSAGALVCDTFADVSKMLRAQNAKPHTKKENVIGVRKHSMIVSHISGDRGDELQLIGNELLQTVNQNSVASLTLSLLLGKQVESKKAIEFVDFVLRLLVDHGPYVSGALNTIVAARAGKDLVSSLVAGLLTIGPRFGGAINSAGAIWLKGATETISAQEFVESFKDTGGVISGIGHKKYRTDLPDPRVEALRQFAGNSNGDRYLKFALEVEAVTTGKKSNLILNVDGAIAALMLDILESELDYTKQQLLELVEIEFFNALFVLSRSVGFTAHYLDQKRHDEGLLRLSDDEVRYIF